MRRPGQQFGPFFWRARAGFATLFTANRRFNRQPLPGSDQPPLFPQGIDPFAPMRDRRHEEAASLGRDPRDRMSDRLRAEPAVSIFKDAAANENPAMRRVFYFARAAHARCGKETKSARAARARKHCAAPRVRGCRVGACGATAAFALALRRSRGALHTARRYGRALKSSESEERRRRRHRCAADAIGAAL